MTPAVGRYADERIRTGLATLLAGQDADGCWRDYRLAPGASEAWCTAWIGWHVLRFAHTRVCQLAVRRAAAAVLRGRGAGGWGYNAKTGPDADSTAWSVRLLCSAGYRCGQAEGARLSGFVDADGRAHTFEGAEHGTWSGAHDDVTPNLGLALLACDPRNAVLGRVRTAVANAQRSDGLWSSFWWASDLYSSFWSTYFLRRTGVLSEQAEARIPHVHETGSALEEALWLLLALERRFPDRSLEVSSVVRLLEMSTENGWPGSPLLLVPRRFDGDTASPVGPHTDDRGLMTTATACWALARWSALRRAHIAATPVRIMLPASASTALRAARPPFLSDDGYNRKTCRKIHKVPHTWQMTLWSKAMWLRDLCGSRKS